MSRRVRGACVVLALCAAANAWSAPAAPGKRGRALPPAHVVSRDNLARLRARLAAGPGLAPAKPARADSLCFVALRIDFPDLPMLQSPGPDSLHDRFYFQNQFRYVGQYFAAASCNRLRLAVDVPDLVAHAAEPAVAYGDVEHYDSLMVRLASEAVRAADPEVDFAAYAGVLLIHAGPGQESDIAGDSPAQIWSGFLDDTTFREQLSTRDSVVAGIATDDGVLVRNVVILPEWEVQDLQASGGTRLGSLGVYAHEVGQRLGMIPLFDSSPANFPDSQGLGNFDVMGYGLWVANGKIPPLPSAFNRVLMGWAEPIEVRAPPTDVVLRDHERGPADSVVARVWISPREYFLVSYVLEDPDGPIVKTCPPPLQSDAPQRYFEFEDLNHNCWFDYEDRDGNGVLSAGDLVDSYAGAEWDFFMTDLLGGSSAGEGSGLLVLHVDEQVLQEVLARGSTNVEGDPRRKAVDVEEADGIEDLDRVPDNSRSFGSADDYWRSGFAFGPTSTPDTRSSSGAPTGLGIELVAPPDSAGARLHIVRGATGPSAAAPLLRARRELPAGAGSDPVALRLADGRAALVVPADSGRVLLADADLDEAPASDGDPSTLGAWVTVPPEWRGGWVGPPAVGDVDGDGAPDVVLSAAIDSAGTRIARIFAWRRDGGELRDLDPAIDNGLFASFTGRASPPLLFDFDGDGRQDLVVARDRTGGGVQVLEFFARSGGTWEERASGVATGSANSAPIVARLPSDPAAPVFAVALVVADSARDVQCLVLALSPVEGKALAPWLEMPLEPGEVRLASGDLDGNGFEEIVVASPRGQVRIASLDGARPHSSPGVAADLHAESVSPLALADTDGDGTCEILLATATQMHVLSSTGAELGGWPYPFRLEPGLEHEPEPGRGAGSPLVADLDGSGDPEIVLHLPGGALLVWDARGERRRDLEAALPARAAATPLALDLDARPGIEVTSLARFASAARYDAPAESLWVAPQTEIAVWNFPRGGEIAWGELGGGPGHTFHEGRARIVETRPNDLGLPSFVVGPNPASTEVRARVELTAPAEARCRLFTLEGEVVREARRAGPAGSIVEVVFDVAGLAPGVYLAQLDLSTGGRRTRPVAIRR